MTGVSLMPCLHSQCNSASGSPPVACSPLGGSLSGGSPEGRLPHRPELRRPERQEIGIGGSLPDLSANKPRCGLARISCRTSLGGRPDQIRKERCEVRAPRARGKTFIGVAAALTLL